MNEPQVNIYEIKMSEESGEYSASLIREIDVSGGRIACMDWYGDTLAVGTSTGVIQLHDLRVRNSLSAKLITHKNEIISLKYNRDGHFLASSSMDHSICIWEDPGCEEVVTKPYVRFTHHEAPVKAMSWCPFKYNHLATGGNDRKIRIWNLRTKKLERVTEVEGEVVGLHFSPWEQQLVTVQGYPVNTVKVWNFTSMKLLATLEGHSDSILHSIHKGEYLITLAEDERMKFWRIFNPPKDFAPEELTMGDIFGNSSLR